MEYKVLIKLYVPEIEENFELYIPINKTIFQVSKLINSIISEITSSVYPIKEHNTLYDRQTGKVYDYNLLVRTTDIRNGSELILL